MLNSHCISPVREISRLWSAGDQRLTQADPHTLTHLCPDSSNCFKVMNPELCKSTPVDKAGCRKVSVVLLSTPARRAGVCALCKTVDKGPQIDVRLMPQHQPCRRLYGFQEKCQEPFPKKREQVGDDKECLSKWCMALLYQKWSCARDLTMLQKSQIMGKRMKGNLCKHCLKQRNDKCPGEGSFKHFSELHYNQGVGK